MDVRDRNFGDVGAGNISVLLFSLSLSFSVEIASALNVICPSFRIAATRMEHQHPDQARPLADFCESFVIYS